MSFNFNRLDAGALVLVTGGTGLIGSSVVTTLLDRGFKVRTSTRSVEKQQLFQHTLEDKYGKAAVEFVQVSDYADGATWDGLLKGVQGVVHLATDVSFSPSYDELVPGVEAMTVALLEAAARAGSLKSIAFTSSRIAIFAPEHGKDVNVTVKDWADYFVDVAKTIKSDDPFAPVAVYAASKVRTERVAWEWLSKNKVSFSFNAVLPDYVAGPVANPVKGNYSTHTFLNQLFHGDINSYAVAFMNPASRLVDVRDAAAVHVAALLESNTNGKRFWAAPHSFVIDDILAAWREAFPDHKIVPDFQFKDQPAVNIDDEASTALLKAFKGADWTPLKDTVVANVQNVL